MARRCRLEFEELAQRILPSVSVGPFPFTGPVQVAQQAHAVAGQGTGTYTEGWPPIPDMGRSASLTGTADLEALGHVSVTGRVWGTGFVLFGNAGGTLTFTNDQGSVTVSLTGPRERGFAPLPQQYEYRVTGGTGAYQHLHDQGALTLVLQPALVKAQSGPALPVSVGTFTLTIAGGYKPARATSGIDGVATEAPLQPVLPVFGPYPSDALAGAIISIEPVGGGAEIARAIAGSDGRFSIALPPGQYRLVPLPPTPGALYPRSGALTIVVRPGQYTHVSVNYDSGLRYAVAPPQG